MSTAEAAQASDPLREIRERIEQVDREIIGLIGERVQLAR